MNQRKVYWYFLKQSVLFTLFAVGIYLLTITGINALMGSEKDTSTLYMSVIVVFMLSSTLKDMVCQRCSTFLMSRKLLFRLQVAIDIVLAILMTIMYMFITSFESGITCLFLMLCVEATITLDSFRESPWFQGLFGSNKTAHPLLGFAIYVLMIIVISLGFTVIEEKRTLWLCVLVYSGAAIATIACYVGARFLSTKKEF